MQRIEVPEHIKFDLTNRMGQTVHVGFEDTGADMCPMSVLGLDDNTSITILYDKEASPAEYVAIHDLESGTTISEFRDTDKDAFAAKLNQYTNNYEKMVTSSAIARCCVKLTMSASENIPADVLKSLLLKLIKENGEDLVLKVYWKGSTATVTALPKNDNVDYPDSIITERLESLMFLNAEAAEMPGLMPLVPDPNLFKEAHILLAGTNAVSDHPSQGTIDILGGELEIDGIGIPFARDRPAYHIRWEKPGEFRRSIDE